MKYDNCTVTYIQGQIESSSSSINLGNQQQQNVYDNTFVNSTVSYIQSSSENNTPVPLQYEIRDEVYNFTGREQELEAINYHFKKGEKKLVVTGMAGVGKSELIQNLSAEIPRFIKVKYGSMQRMKQI